MKLRTFHFNARFLTFAVAIIGLTFGKSHAASILAASPAYGDVASAVGKAQTGDVVYVPRGFATWTNVLQITQGITLVGAGTNATVITNAIPVASPWSLSLRPPLIWIRITNDTPVRVTQFYFYCNFTSGGQGILADPINLKGNPPLHALRVDHCIFDRAKSRAIEIEGSVYGVIDHCLFRNCELTTEPVSGHNKEWSQFSPPYYGLGTTNTIVVEDSTVLWDGEALTFGLGGPAPAACGQGGHYVWRFNTMLNVAPISGDGLDLHGNNYYDGTDPLYSTTPQKGWRGSIWFECYSNRFELSSKCFRSMKLRGGTCMVFGNTFIGSSSACAIILDEEESWDTNDFSPLRVSWPAQDQITNSFFWGNTVNGVATNDVRRYVPPAKYTPVVDPVGVFVQEGRDYWRRPPGPGDALADYVPLVYPHPLVTSQPSYERVHPPSGLRVAPP